MLTRLAIRPIEKSPRKRDMEASLILGDIERRRSRELLIRETPLVLARVLHVDGDMNRLDRVKLRDGRAHVGEGISVDWNGEQKGEQSGQASHSRRSMR